MRGDPEASETSISGTTRLLAIIGDPVLQVRSPEMFNALFRARRYDAVMVPMQVSAAELDDVLPRLKRIHNLHGFVVTVPHKIAATRHADRLLVDAAAVGAINALARQEDGTWTGGMFDGQGFLTALVNGGFEPRDRCVLIAGAGGVGRSIAFSLAAAGIAALHIREVDRQRAEELAQALSSRFPKLELRAAVPIPQECSLAVNATPLGMQSDDPLPFDPAAFPRSTWIADAVMKPDVTRLLAVASARGQTVVLGRRILENQIVALASFFGVPD